MRSEPTWPFTGAQVVQAVRVIVAGLDQARKEARDRYEDRHRQHKEALAAWEALPERKRGERPMFGDESMAMLSYEQSLRGAREARLAEVGAYALEPDRIFQLTVDDVAHFGLGVKEAPDGPVS